MSRLKDLVVAAGVLLVSRGRPRPEAPGEPMVAAGEREPRGELGAIALLLLGAALAIAFIVVYALDDIPHQTQWLGACLGGSLVSIAAALFVVASRLVVTEELEEDYPAHEHPEEQRMVVQTLQESASRITRRRLFAFGLAASGGSLGLALLTPLASLGPVLDTESLYHTPWRRGRRLVDENGKPFRASDIELDDFYTAFPEGADREDLSSPVVLVRLRPHDLDLPPENAHYDAAGIVAYSKICTHAGCAISLYRTPLFPPAEPGPALVCPCHYSTFSPGTGGTVIYGPAGRKLPMLPLLIDRRGGLRAAGNFDGPVGPSWWGVRLRRPT